MNYDLEGKAYTDDIGNMAAEAGLLAAVESFLRGLPSEVRNKLSAGELADTVLNTIDSVRSKRREH